MGILLLSSMRECQSCTSEPYRNQ